MKRFLWAILFSAGLVVSCAPFSKEMMRQVDESLTFREVQKDPQLFLGKTVLWGGLIVETTNRKNETLIQVMQTELDYEKKPENLDGSGGRFLVRYDGFLDPVIYSKGREITVAGEVVGKEVLPLGEIQYAYPIILAKEIRLWEKRQVVRPVYPPWYWDPYPFWWYRYPYWWYRPYR